MKWRKHEIKMFKTTRTKKQWMDRPEHKPIRARMISIVASGPRVTRGAGRPASRGDHGGRGTQLSVPGDPSITQTLNKQRISKPDQQTHTRLFLHSNKHVNMYKHLWYRHRYPYAHTHTHVNTYAYPNTISYKWTSTDAQNRTHGQSKTHKQTHPKLQCQINM